MDIFSFLNIFNVSLGIVIVVNLFGMLTKNRCFYQEKGFPVTLFCTGTALGAALQDKPPLWGIVCVITILVITVVSWKKLIGRVASLFRTEGVK